MSESFVTPGTVPHQAPLSVGFPRQEYLGGLPFPSGGDLPNPGIEPHLLHLLHWQADSLLLVPPEKLLSDPIPHGVTNPNPQGFTSQP